eukprot:6014268-Prymnesium_polylepis.3
MAEPSEMARSDLVGELGHSTPSNPGSIPSGEGVVRPPCSLLDTRFCAQNEREPSGKREGTNIGPRARWRNLW